MSIGTPITRNSGIFVETWSAQTVHGSSTCFLLLVFFWGRSILKWIQLYFITTNEFTRTEIVGLSGIPPIGVLCEDENDIKVSRQAEWVCQGPPQTWMLNELYIHIHKHIVFYILYIITYIIYITLNYQHTCISNNWW